jgi:vacuolar protein sorting-associated protein 13A/C
VVHFTPPGMAKELLLNALVGVLGDYVEGITQENLKVGVWSGKIELKNLQLNRYGIEKLKLPVSILNGYVKTLTVSIPWTSLASQPVKIFIDGVHLLLGPLDFHSFNSQEATERALLQKKSRLLQAEKAVEFAASLTEQNDPKAATYFQNLTTKIIDNIEIKISNIHIRYEDSQTFPGETFSCGLTLENFIVTTTNSRWEETFVAREGEKEQAIYKKAKIENFVMYWNINSPQLSHLQFDQWMAAMQNLIYQKNHPVASVQYLLTPENSLEIKLTHHDKEGHIPRLHAAIESTKIGLSVTKSQYHQMMRSLDAYNTVSVKQQLLRFRPARRPVDHETSRQWWKYALVLLTNNELILQSKVRFPHLLS